MEKFIITNCHGKKLCTFRVKNNNFKDVLDYLNYNPNQKNFTQVAGITAYECILKYASFKEIKNKNVYDLTKMEWVYVELF